LWVSKIQQPILVNIFSLQGPWAWHSSVAQSVCRTFCLPDLLQIISWVHPAPSPTGKYCSFPEGKAAGSWSWQISFIYVDLLQNITLSIICKYAPGKLQELMTANGNVKYLFPLKCSHCL
jgi:hypothetical protein